MRKEIDVLSILEKNTIIKTFCKLKNFHTYYTIISNLLEYFIRISLLIIQTFRNLKRLFLDGIKTLFVAIFLSIHLNIQHMD